MFPGTDLLEERARCAAAVHVDARVGWRISITLPVINQAHRVLALAAGRRKADIIRRVLAAPPPTPPYPAQRLAPRAGVEWHLDEAAASALPGEVRA
ncbi:MAG: 6-phosphogluconolactonase [Gammaproteobacteria bacterium]|nr:6-phosphogluconolactonase [Gammaproteobacteria bacterium]